MMRSLTLSLVIAAGMLASSHTFAGDPYAHIPPLYFQQGDVLANYLSRIPTNGNPVTQTPAQVWADLYPGTAANFDGYQSNLALVLAVPDSTPAQLIVDVTVFDLIPVFQHMTDAQAATVIQDLQVFGFSATTLTTLVAGARGLCMDGVLSTAEAAQVLVELRTAGAPDFVITEITLDPPVPAADGTFKVAVKVQNQGSKAGNGGGLDVWLAWDAGATTAPKADKTASVGTLKVGQSKTLTFASLKAGATVGARVLRVLVDAKNQVAESDETNNAAVTNWRVDRPDFVVTGVVFSPNPPPAGGTFAATVTVANIGDSPGDAGAVDVWLNPATVIVLGPKTRGDRTVAAGVLQAGQAKALRFTQLRAGTANGDQAFRATVDTKTKTGESVETNNHGSWSYHVGWPDFTIKKIELTPTPPSCAKTFTAYVTVTNSGEASGNAGSVDVWAHQPTDQVAGAKTKGDKTVAAGVLEPGQDKRLPFTGLKAGTGGAYEFRAMVDGRAKTTESNDLNNQATQPYTCAAPGP